MEQDINLVIEQFKQDIFQRCQDAQLPISIIYYVMKDLFKEIESDYINYVNKAAREQQMKMQEAAAQVAETAAPATEENTEKEKVED